MTNKLTKWIQWTTLLLVAGGLLLAPMSSVTAQSQPEQGFGPSSYLPMLRNNYCNGTLPDDGQIGTQLYGITGYSTDSFHFLQNTQTPWLRNTIEWIQIEPVDVAPAQYNWLHVDLIVNAAKHNCQNLIITVEKLPGWARTEGDRSPIKPEHIVDFVELMTALVERYDGDGDGDAPSGIVVNYWEIFNEPDFGSRFSGNIGYGEHGDLYAELLEAIYQPMKIASDDQAQIVFGGIAYNNFLSEDGNTGRFVREFFKDVLDAGGGDFFDYMNFHYYPFQRNRGIWTDGDASGLREKYQSLKDELEAHDLDKPFMITEIGWHNDTEQADAPTTDDFQARRVVELLAQAMALRIRVTIWWAFTEVNEFLYLTGLLAETTPLTPKPAYFAYDEAVKRLGNANFVAETMVPTTNNDLEAYEFEDDNSGQTFYVAWLNPTVYTGPDAVDEFEQIKDQTQNLTVPGNRATIFDKMGVQLRVVNDDADGDNDDEITISVGRDPIYIVIN